MGIFYNSSNILKNLVSEVIYQSKPLDKSIESIFRNTPGIQPSEKESLFRMFTFVIRRWVTIHELYKLQFSSGNIDFHEILHIQHILERYFTGKLVCKGLYEKKVLENLKKIGTQDHLINSYPEWLYGLLWQELGAKTAEILPCLNQNPSTVLRTNSLKTSTCDLTKKLISKGKFVAEINGFPEAILVNRYFDIFRSEEFKAGLFEIQDAGSQAIAPYVDAEPGMRVIDACAGNGGKTLHLSGLMRNKGKIIALDIAPYKLETLKKRMKRAGSFNIETRPIDSLKTIKRLEKSADRLLLDVPCSGTGVLKRNPDIKYHLTPENIKNIKVTQQDILNRYSCMLNKGGIMVYSTCSILPSENQEQIKLFLEKKQGDYELLSERTISPLEGFDGFYMAKIKRCS